MEQKGVNDGAADQPEVNDNKDGLVAAQNVDNKDQGANDDGKNKDQNVSVPLPVVKAVRDENKSLKERIATLEAQAQQPAQRQTPAAETFKNPFEGQDETSVVTIGEVSKVIEQMTSQNQNLNAKLYELEFFVNNEGARETINKYLPGVINNPGVRDAIRSSANPYEAALHYAKTNPDFQKTQKPPEDETTSELDKILANLNKPGSVSQAVGGGGGAINVKNRFAQMGDEEFDKHMNDVIMGRTG